VQDVAVGEGEFRCGETFHASSGMSLEICYFGSLTSL
jgi:hypothetical protein